MATEIEGLSLSSLDAMRNVMDLLNDMLQAVTPGDSLVCSMMFIALSYSAYEKYSHPSNLCL